MTDTGVAPDQQAGDGIYAGQWTPQDDDPSTVTFPGGDTVLIMPRVAPFTVVEGGSFVLSPGATQPVRVRFRPAALEEYSAFVQFASNADNGMVSRQVTGRGSRALWIMNAGVAEGNAGTAQAIFTVAVDPLSSETVTVSYATADGTATAPYDYTAQSGTLVFAPGVSQLRITVLVNGDTVAEPDETFFVNLSAPEGAIIGGAQGLGVIRNDEAIQPVLHSLTANLPSPQKVGTPITFTAVASGGHGPLRYAFSAQADGEAPVTLQRWSAKSAVTWTPTAPSVHYRIGVEVANEDMRGGTAYTSMDFVITPLKPVVNSITPDLPPPLPAGIPRKFTADASGGWPPLQYKWWLDDEVGTVVLQNWSPNAFVAWTPPVPGSNYRIGVTVRSADDTSENGAASLGVPILIVPPDSGSWLKVDDVTVTEGNGAMTTATVRVTLTRASTETVAVMFATSNGTAGAPGDYLARSGKLTFMAGVTTRTIAVQVNSDTSVEGDEAFVVNLSAAVNAVIGDVQGVVTIHDAASPPTVDSLTANRPSPQPVNTPITFTAVATAGIKPLQYKWLLSTGGTPTVMQKWSTNPSVTWTPTAAGDDYRIVVWARNAFDTSDTGAVSFSIPFVVTPLTGAVLTIDDVTVSEGNAGSRIATFTVTLTPASTETVTVMFATANGSAIASSDYWWRSGRLTFMPGVTTRSVAVPVSGDVMFEPNETFVINLSAPVYAVLGKAQGIATITNDDAPPTAPTSPPP